MTGTRCRSFDAESTLTDACADGTERGSRHQLRGGGGGGKESDNYVQWIEVRGVPGVPTDSTDNSRQKMAKLMAGV